MFPSGSPGGAAPEASRALEATRARPVLAPFSTRLPPELIERLRIAAPQLRRRQGEIAAVAIDHYLQDHGY